MFGVYVEGNIAKQAQLRHRICHRYQNIATHKSPCKVPHALIPGKRLVVEAMFSLRPVPDRPCSLLLDTTAWIR
jgi:hypothetical protein